MAQRARRRSLLLAVAMLLCGRHAIGQTIVPQPPGEAAAPVAFDVVSVKPFDPNRRVSMMGLRYSADGIEAQSVTIPMLIRAAYGGFMKLPSDDSVTSLPDWAKSASFEIDAKMSEADAAEFAKLSKDEQEQRRESLLQSLLADRFKLKAHREIKQAPDYELVVAKGGPKFKEADPNLKGPDGKPIQGNYIRLYGNGKLDAQASTIPQLASLLMQPFIGVGRRVVDKTGLTGRYTFTLAWTPDPTASLAGSGGLPPPPPPSGDNSAPSIFTALQEQLGLKLQPETGTFDVIVVDHVERPSEN